MTTEVYILVFSLSNYQSVMMAQRPHDP